VKKEMIRKLLVLVVAAVTIIALVVPGCTPATLYNLTMDMDPAGGGTATDVTGASPYAAGTEVDIQATANAGYVFTGWTTDAGGTFDDAGAATTKFSMPSNDVTVTANFVPAYDLEMTVSPAGAGTTTPTGTTQQGEGLDVNIQAVATAPYQFVYWSATAGTFGDANAATTTFTMPAEDVTVTAHFVGPLDHFKCYSAEDTAGEPVGVDVSLKDQFVDIDAEVQWAVIFANPAKKTHEGVTPISNPDHHFTVYTIDYLDEPDTWLVEVQNQFGVQFLTVSGPVALAVPTQKGDHEAPLNLDHYLLYEVIGGTPLDVVVQLEDQFLGEPDASVYEPILFANPVQKTHAGGAPTPIENPEDHLVFYHIFVEGEHEVRQVQAVNQFGEQDLDVYDPALLAVPSEKLSFGPVVDHFKCYDAQDVEGVPIMQDVTLEDQFGSLEATVEVAWFFGNPAVKVHGDWEMPILHPDHHFTVYKISYTGLPKEWTVGVRNQFGVDQNLTVSGPVALVVPTQKMDHEPPVGLDHYLLYEVIDGPPMGTFVMLFDQFEIEPDALVTIPRYFANPVKKTHDGVVTEIVNPLAHLVFYEILTPPFFLPGLPVVNQFGAQLLDVFIDPPLHPALLAAPSAKLYFDPMF